MTFNLIDDPWIDVSRGGVVERLSLRRVLNEAHELDSLQPPTPISLVAVLRELLAVLYRVMEGPRSTAEAAALFAKGRFPLEQVNAYLDRWGGSFELFDDVKPFMQTPDSEDKVSSIARLAVEASTGTNKVLFDHSVDSRPVAKTAAEAAVLLVTRQATAVPEGAGYSPSPAGGVAFVMPQGRNLFETLVLNLVPYLAVENEDDLACWERDPPSASRIKEGGGRGATGLADRYTWLSRIVKLLPDAAGNVSHVHYAAGTKFEMERSLDPMVAYRKDPKRGLLALTFQAGKDFWRDFAALLPGPEGKEFIAPRTLLHAYNVYAELGRSEPLKIHAAGLRNDKAKVEFWRSVTFDVPLVLLHDEDAQGQFDGLMLMADETGRKLYGATMRLAEGLLTTSERQPAKSDIANLARSMPASAHFWSQCERKFPALLRTLAQDGIEKATSWWRAELLRAMREAWILACSSAGDNPRAWRAVALSERPIGAQVRRLRDAATA